MSKRFKYADIVAYFRQKIENGELRPGDRLPSMGDVVHEFHVSTPTANHAYRALKEQGLTRAIPGVGTVVADPGQQNELAVRAVGSQSPSMIELSREEGAALFDGRARRWLGMSGAEFLDRWDAGEYAGTDNPAVAAIAVLIPFARTVSSAPREEQEDKPQ